MSGKEQHPVSEILDQEFELSLKELCQHLDLEAELLMEWVEEGVAKPRSSTGQEWRFGARQFKRVRLACSLRRDLGLDTPALPLVLDLLEERERLRQQVRMLKRLIE